jgi:hypothetical protein
LRFIDRLFVMLFVRRKAQAHARAVLADKRTVRKGTAATGKAAKQGATAAATPDVSSTADPVPPVAVAAVAAAADAADAGPAAVAASLGYTTPASATDSTVAATPREALIRDALAARKTREAEWDALTPEQQQRAIAGLGEGMAALVRAFRAA